MGQRDDKYDNKGRWRISVRMRAIYLDVERILANWREQQQEASNLAAAIRLYDAVLRGDVEQIRQIAPLLGPALNPIPATPSKRRTDPLLDSESKDQKKESKEETAAFSELVQAVVDVTLIDLTINQRRIETLARTLLRAGYTGDQVQDWYERWWKLEDWRGKKGERPRLQDIRELIGCVRTLPPPGIPSPAAADPPKQGAAAQQEATGNPYLRDEYFRRHAGEPQAAPAPELRPEVRQGKLYDAWLAGRGQLQISLDRTTFNAWGSRLRLVKAEQSGQIRSFTLEAPDQRVKDWVERHLMAGVQTSIASWLEMLRHGDPPVQVKIKIILPDEDLSP